MNITQMFPRPKRSHGRGDANEKKSPRFLAGIPQVVPRKASKNDLLQSNPSKDRK